MPLSKAMQGLHDSLDLYSSHLRGNAREINKYKFASGDGYGLHRKAYRWWKEKVNWG